jgi:hypothetical protein
MSGNADHWRDDIWQRFGALFDNSAPFRTGLASLPDGWHETVASLLERAETIVRADKNGRLTITRLQQRDANLLVEHLAVNFLFVPMIEDVFDHARARAACSCEVCGASARRYHGVHGASVRCDTHRSSESTEIKPNWPMIRIDREIGGGVSRVTRCRIYDRDADRFVDVASEELGIPRSP